MPAVHDRGGMASNDPINQSDHQLADWELRTHALLIVLRESGFIGTDELRRSLESASPEEYEGLSYYEKWASSIQSLLVEKKILTTSEIDEKTKVLEKLWEDQA